MKKIALTLLSIVFVLSSVLAQKTNDGGGNNPSNNNNNNDNNNNNSGDNTCMSSVLDLGAVLAGAYHKNLLSSKKKNPSVISLEVAAIGGLAANMNGLVSSNYYNILPKVKVNYGAYSAEIRYNSMMWVDDPSISSKAIDGLVEFNIIPHKSFKLAIGQGVFYNFDSETAYHESLLSADIAVAGRSIIVSPEGRFIYDWANSETVYYEVSLTGGYRLVKAGPLNIMANAGVAYRNVTRTIDYGIVFGGLTFIIQ